MDFRASPKHTQRIMKKVSLIVPCWGRPQRTLRAMQCVLEQDMDGWEAIFLGDGCPEFQKMIDDGIFDIFEDNADIRGNEFRIYNLENHYGGCGYQARNTAFKLTNSEYTLFMDNDDVIKRNHFRSYYSAINTTDLDMMYFDTYIEPVDTIRVSQLVSGYIGHSEIILKSDLLKNYQQSPNYGHDWELIKNLIDKGIKIGKSHNPPTYIIKELGGGHENRERLSEKNIN